MTLRGMSQTRLVPDGNGAVLNRRKLYTLCLESPGTPPFLSRVAAPSGDVAISLLVDQSGSMNGARLRLAQKCAVMLAETMDQARIPLEVIGFSTKHDHGFLAELHKSEQLPVAEIEFQFARYVPTLHLIYKSFREPLRQCRGRLSSMRAYYYTPINESILLAGKRLSNVRAGRRLLVILTDGNVMLGSPQTKHIARQNLLDNLALLGKAGVEVLAVGIQTTYVGDVFNNSIVVHELAQLPAEFLGAVGRSLCGY
jgi:cobalamin biosynthesis protein CobT